MLKKLIKHEYKATAKVYLMIFAIMAIVTLLYKGYLALNLQGQIFGFFEGIIAFSYYVGLFGGLVVGFCFIIVRFYKNLVTDEGYLTFTLPVETGSLIISKLLVALTWFVGLIIIIILSLLFIKNDVNIINTLISSITNGIKEAFSNTSTRTFAIMMIVYITAVVVQNILLFYAAIACGQLVQKNRIIGSIAGYFVLYMVNNIVMLILILMVAVFFPGLLKSDASVVEYSNAFSWVFAIGTVLSVSMSVAFFKLTKYMFDKKLNLE